MKALRLISEEVLKRFPMHPNAPKTKNCGRITRSPCHASEAAADSSCTLAERRVRDP